MRAPTHMITIPTVLGSGEPHRTLSIIVVQSLSFIVIIHIVLMLRNTYMCNNAAQRYDTIRQYDDTTIYVTALTCSTLRSNR